MTIPHVDPLQILLNGCFILTPLLLFLRFLLDMSGTTRLFRGDDVMSAMTGIHIHGNRRWLGWYNTPGSFQIAKRFHLIATSASFRRTFRRNRSSRSFSDDVYLDPTTLFESDGASCRGPKFRAAHSHTAIEETGYLASLLMKECTALDVERKVVPGRKTQPVEITIADLRQPLSSELQPARASVLALLAASVTIAVSVGTCVLCAVFQDRFASLSILVGIVASGSSCLVLGSADLMFIHPVPPKGFPPGDGILGSKRDIVLLKGTEGVVSSITCGQFFLCLPSAAHCNRILCCSLLFSLQCVTQLFLILEASLFGQAMFLVSHGVSALYNAWLSSSDMDKVRRRLLFQRALVVPTFAAYTLGTRPTAVVFILLVLQPRDPMMLLDELLPEDTKVWKQWKKVILEQLRHPGDDAFLSDCEQGDVDGFTRQEQCLLNVLIGDARAAHNGYKDYLGIESL